MEVSGFGQTAPNSSSQENSSLSSLTKNFDNFLLLLTKQLQYQDPLSPLDTNEFTSQLVQFSGVEQSINTNSKLDQLIGVQTNNQALGALSFLNTTIEADTDQLALSDGEGEIHYELPQDASEVVIVILDAAGKPVRTIEEGELDAGEHSLTWDGTDNDGVALPDGTYHVQIAAANENDQLIAATTKIVGEVAGVQMENGQILLDLGGGIQIPASQVRSVRGPSSA